MKNKIYILSTLVLLSCNATPSVSSSKDVTKESDNQFDLEMGSSSMIFWKGSENSFDFIISILDNLNISYQKLNNQEMDSTDFTVDGYRDIELSRITHQDSSWSSLFLNLNSQQSNKIASEISERLNTPVISFHEYDESAWGFKLFDEGQLKNSFWNQPEILELSKESAKADIQLMSEIFNKDSVLIAPYFIHLTPDGNYGKVNVGDEFKLDDHWVRTDVMQHLGLTYPEGGTYLYIQE